MKISKCELPTSPSTCPNESKCRGESRSPWCGNMCQGKCVCNLICQLLREPRLAILAGEPVLGPWCGKLSWEPGLNLVLDPGLETMGSCAWRLGSISTASTSQKLQQLHPNDLQISHLTPLHTKRTQLFVQESLSFNNFLFCHFATVTPIRQGPESDPIWIWTSEPHSPNLGPC